MDRFEEDFSTQEESKQMKFLQIYQKLVIYTLLKFKKSILLIFAFTVVAGFVGRYVQYHRDPYKCEGSVTLFYTPRASEEVKPLSINHVLGVFNRQGVFHQIVEELQLTAAQQSALKGGIEVKLLKDQNDMFVITGKGESDEYVRNLVNTFAAIGIRNYEEYRSKELRDYLTARENRLREIQAYQISQIEALHALHRQYGIIHPKEEMDSVKKMQMEQKAAMAELNVKLSEARHQFAVAEKSYLAVPESVILNRGRLLLYVTELRSLSREYERARLSYPEQNPRFIEAKGAYEAVLNEFEAFKKEYGITEFEESMLLGLDGIVTAYNNAEITLQQVELSMQALEAEIALVREREEKLQHMIPEHDRVEMLMQTSGKNVSLLIEELTRVRSSLANVTNEIIINERVVNTKSFPVFPSKIIILIFMGGIVVSGIYASIRIFFDIYYGKFGGIEEAHFHKDFFEVVGVIPDANAKFTPQQRNIINNEMFYHFIMRLKDTRTIFSCSLDGSFLSSVLFDNHFTKARRNTILVRLIPVSEVEKICSGMMKIGDFYYSDNGNTGTNFVNKDVSHSIEYLQGFSSGDGKGYGYGYGFAFFPIRDVSCLEPDEISTLYNIVNELKKHYQLIRIAREKPFDASCLIMRQLHDICDATFLYIGKNKTPRSVMRRFLKLHDEKHKVYAVLTGVTNVEKIISGDYIR